MQTDKERDISGDVEEILKKVSDGRRNKSFELSNSDVEFEIGKIAFAEDNELPDIKDSALTEKDEDNTGEFELPNIFDIAEKEVAEEINDNLSKVRTTYIPRFTDVSDSYNRLGYVPENSDAKEKLEISSVDGAAMDPTAEIDAETVSDAKVVSVNSGNGEIIDTSTTMFKFELEEKPCGSQEENGENINATPESAISEEVKAEIPKEQNSVETPIVVIDEPIVNKSPVKYVPTSVARSETVAGVGDELSGYDKSEYNSDSKRDVIKDKFLDRLFSQKLRLFVAIAISLALLIFENIGIFGVDLISLFNFQAMPESLAIIDLNFALCLFVLAAPEFVAALRKLFSKQFTSDLFILPAFLVYIAYSVSIILKKPSEYALLGSLIAVFSVSLIFSACLKTSADFTAFKFISKHGEKKVVDNKLTRRLENENMALDGVVEEYKSRTARVFKTSFIADFFRRTKRDSENRFHVIFLLAIPLGVAFISSVVAYFVSEGFVPAVSTFAFVYLIALPSVSVLAHKLPHYCASLEAVSENGAIIGENAHFDYSGIDVVCFEDTEIFDAEDVNIQRIILFGNSENLTKALRQMAALFMNVGGPLDKIFTGALDKKCASANGVFISENGIVGEIDGNKVCAGTYDFMVADGVVIPENEAECRQNTGATKIMYAAENGIAYAKFYIRYRFSEEFTMLMPTLREEGIIPLIYTRDPNVNNELLKTLTAGTSTVRILKKNTTPVKDFAPSKISAGMVSNGDKSNLVNLILLTKRYAKFNKFVKLVERTAMIVGMPLGILFASVGGVSFSLLFVLWQMGFSVALGILSRKFFNVPKKKKEKQKNEA